MSIYESQQKCWSPEIQTHDPIYIYFAPLDLYPRYVVFSNIRLIFCKLNNDFKLKKILTCFFEVDKSNYKSFQTNSNIDQMASMHYQY